MDDTARRLILAGEISAFTHDLGKLHPGFAEESLGGGHLGDEARQQAHMYQAHGAILEPGRIYPDDEELSSRPELRACLDRLRNHPGWAESLRVPHEWCLPDTVPAPGLGVALNHHHATDKFLEGRRSLLGDLYSFAADIRDSALDKGSSGTGQGPQGLDHASIADGFGLPAKAYSPEGLRTLWNGVPEALAVLWEDQAWQDPASTRQKLRDSLEGLFRAALGETRRPTHDVTLWHHSLSTASHFKAALAEGVLRRDFGRWQDETGLFDVGRMGRIRFRLLGIRWDWRELTRQALRPVTLVSLSERREQTVAAIRQFVEVDHPIGNLIYEDDDGVLILAPGFYEDDPDESERLFASHILDPLQDRLAAAIAAGFGPGVDFRLCWGEPTLYLTDYVEALGHGEDSGRRRPLQAGVAALRQLWRDANASPAGSMQICPQCGLRPAPARELEAVEGGLEHQTLCGFCKDLQSDEARQSRFEMAERLFGFRPRGFNLHALVKAGGDGNSRVALLSVRIDPEAIATGNALITQLARPAHDLKGLAVEWGESTGLGNTMGAWFDELLNHLRKEDDTWLHEKIKVKIAPKGGNEGVKPKPSQEEKPRRDHYARTVLGDLFWLKLRDGQPEDGRSEGSRLERGMQLLDGFFLRESRHLPPELGLVRHDGDRLALFAQRKHASPARLQRLWDDLRDLWRGLLAELDGELKGAVLPLSLDAGGVRCLVAARDATAAVERIRAVVEPRLGKLRGGLAPQVSCLVFREKFPLYLALDATYRMERRIGRMPHQAWTVRGCENLPEQRRAIEWETPQGPVSWTVDLATGDPDQRDIWHPHVIRRRTAAGVEITGPDRLAHVDALTPGDVCLIPPATFDFLVLEGGLRRHDISYRPDADGQLVRPHLVFGEAGKAIGLLEGFDTLASLVRRTQWNASQIKALQGEMIELYENWVREAPAAVQATGREAWATQIRAMLDRYLPDLPGRDRADLRAEVLRAVLDGRFFDAVEWSDFITGGEARPQ